MQFIDSQLVKFKTLLEKSIMEGGTKGKTSAIRSSTLINLIHDAVKEQLIKHKVDPDLVYPRLYETKPEIKVAGFLKQKNQDITVLPRNHEKKPVKIDWGPLNFEGITDEYGMEYSSNMLIINVRSQMSSVAKNSDTLFERTFAESLNLHLRYPKVVLGEVYLIPTHEYDEELIKENRIGFKKERINLEKYISFFTAMNNRTLSDGSNEKYRYERVALLIVDFNKEVPKLYSSTEELKKDNLLKKDFDLEYSELNFENFSKDILSIYGERYKLENISLIESSY
ncbi:restriction endonuclease [Miniphocaeibacter massiliensis]|uniref:restriction endonuclease n=1 Tax=Miniphocaeibacter massiliensis TaxID=2041841 RepID=UPI000C1C73C5|nr:restriction endonuclease [Miniphocaeibacter massiliensis]